MWIAKNKSDDIIASNIRLWDEKRAYAWSAASDPEFRETGTNVFLFYSVLQELSNNNISEINIMHGNVPQFAKFATRFNPRLVPYYQIFRNRWGDIIR